MPFFYESSVPDDDLCPDEVDDTPRQPLDARSAHLLALRFQEWTGIDRSGRAGRLEADGRSEPWDEVTARVLDDLDALVTLGVEADDDGAFLDAVATGVLWDVLCFRPDLHRRLADRCLSCAAWRQAVRGVALDPDTVSCLPAPLPDLLPAPPRAEMPGRGPRGPRPPSRWGRKGRIR